MAHPQETEIRRRADGTIDIGFYAARAETMRKAALKLRGKNIAGLLAALARFWQASKRRKTADG